MNEELAAAYPTVPATESARRAAQEAMRTRAAKLHRTRRLRRSLGFAAMTLGGIGLLVGIGPSAYAVYKLRQIEGSVSDAMTAEIDNFDVHPDGTTAPSGRTLYDHAKWRLERGAEYQIWKNGRIWQFEPQMHRVTTKSAPNGPAMYNPSGFSVRSMIADMAGWSWRDKVDYGSGTFEGKHVSKVTITNPNGQERLIVLADPDTSMPLGFQWESNGVAGWSLRGFAKATFDRPLDESLFETSFPRGVAVVDLDKSKADFLRSIEHPVKSFSWQGRTVALRAVVVTPRGHVFVLYTDGETREDRQREANRVLSQAPVTVVRRGEKRPFTVHPEWNVTDSLGQEYFSAGFQPYVAGPTARFTSGVALSDGQVLQGCWFVPADDRPWSPRTVTLSIDGHPDAKVLSIHLLSPNASTVPDWMPSMAMGPGSEIDILRQELISRRAELQQRGDPKLLIDSYERELRLDSEDEHNGRGPWARGELYFGLYKAYNQLGDRQSAIRYLRLASTEPYPTAQLQEAVKAEHLP
jgi:hypothetical protein